MNETTEDERFMRLEVKAAYLEKLALDLNEVVISQGQLLDELFKRIDRLERQPHASSDDVEIPNERPPHS
jgi:uncharacterized coiled-coil protein SlyX